MRRGAGFRGLFVLAFFCLSGAAANAQFIRIGPFDFAATAGLDLIYTTNVDGVRPDQTTKEMEDYYAVASFDLTSTTTIFKDSKLDLSTGISIEKHARRDDLDTLSEPFGRGRVDTEFNFGRYTLRLNAGSETTTETREDTYVPTDIKKKRDVNTITDYGADLEWQRNDLTLRAGAGGSMERHREQEFKVGDQDTYSWSLGADWQFTERVGLIYTFDRDKQDLINQPDSYKGWDEKQSIGLEMEVWERPHFTYTLALEESTVQGDTIDWQWTHTFAVDDGIDLSRTLRLSGRVSYKYAQEYQTDEIALTGDIKLDHELSSTAKHSLSLNKEAAGVFGSTQKIDVTGLDYAFTKRDLFIYNLNFTFNASFTRNKPIEGDGETEDVTVISPELSWERAVSRKLTRSLAYVYDWEHSTLFSEDLTEHRVTLSYTYTF